MHFPVRDKEGWLFHHQLTTLQPTHLNEESQPWGKSVTLNLRRASKAWFTGNHTPNWDPFQKHELAPKKLVGSMLQFVQCRISVARQSTGSVSCIPTIADVRCRSEPTRPRDE
jgi:hypothetical protein